MSHQHIEPKRLGMALATIRDTNVCIRKYTDYWTVRTRHPAKRGASIREKSGPRVATIGKCRFNIGSLAGSQKKVERGRANIAIFKPGKGRRERIARTRPSQPARTSRISESYLYYIRNTKNRTNSTTEMGLGDQGARRPNQNRANVLIDNAF